MTIMRDAPYCFEHVLHTFIWEVLMLVDSEAAARVSGVAETVDYFG